MQHDEPEDVISEVRQGLAITIIRGILANDKDYQTNALKLGAIWNTTTSVGLVYKRCLDGHVEVTEPKPPRFSDGTPVAIYDEQPPSQ